MMIQFLYQILLSLLLLSIEVKTYSDAILLSQVETLTLRANTKTAHRRVPAIPQLTCKGPGCAFHKVDIMRCKNQGSSYDQEDIDWSCTANLPPEFKLGITDVICEGYAYPDDKYVLKRSCGVTYQLLLTDLGQEKYGQFMGFDRNSRPFMNLIVLFVFLGILILILYSAFKAIPFGNYFRPPRRFWGTGGGGGGPWDPPPPYQGKDYSSQQHQPVWEPGFWTGALGGAAAGYFAGNRGGRENTFNPVRDRRRFSDRDEYFRDDSSRSSGSSSSRYESTGFGSTSRR